MADRIVVNTGPLITLAHAGALDVVSRLPLDVYSPEQVRAELDEGTRHGHPAVVAHGRNAGRETRDRRFVFPSAKQPQTGEEIPSR